MKVVAQVYFIKPVGLDGPIKIGHSKVPSIRLIDLGAWSPLPLELVGAVPGTYADEQFLHQCFAEQHSHREWFRSSHELRDAIRRVLDAGTVSALRGIILPKGSIRLGRKPITKERSLCLSYAARIRVAVQRLRAKVGNNGNWYEPEDIRVIQTKMRSRHSPDGDEVARLEEYLANPEIYSIAFPYHKPAAVQQ